MVDATQPAVLKPPVTEISAAVRAVEAEQPRPLLLVTKEDEILAEQPHSERRSTGRQLL